MSSMMCLIKYGRNERSSGMKFLDIFAEIGGFRVGMEQAGNSVTVPVIYEIAKRLEFEVKE